MYAHFWGETTGGGRDASVWSSEFQAYMRSEERMYGLSASRAGHCILAHLEYTFRGWIEAKTEKDYGTGQALLEAILYQLILARNGHEGPLEFAELLKDARAKGKVSSVSSSADWSFRRSALVTSSPRCWARGARGVGLLRKG
jgi:hypothetical protein